MRRKDFIDIIQKASDDELYFLAKKYLIETGIGLNHSNWRCELILEECQRRDSLFYQNALEDSLYIIKYMEDARQGLKVSYFKPLDRISNNEMVKILEKVRGESGIFNDNKFDSGARVSFGDIAEKEYLPYFLGIKKENLYLCRVTGSSMINADIREGDIIAVDFGAIPSSDEIVIASINGDYFVKRLKIVGSSVFLVSENPEMKPVMINDDIKFKVVGVVKYVFHKL